jgi:hypothetical protein
MIEQKLIVGRYIELNNPAPAWAGPAVAGFREQTRLVMHIAESENSAAPIPTFNFPNAPLGVKVQLGFQKAGAGIASQFDRQRVSATGVGAVAKTHRNFVWLEWVPGIVNEVQPQGTDVLTGPMTGCWITAYVRNGVHYVGHVGTDTLPTTQNSIDATNAWNTYARNVPMGTYSGFNPKRNWIGALPPALASEPTGGVKFFGLVASDGTFHIVVTYPQKNQANRIRIAGVQQIRSTLPQNGQIV